MTDKYTIDKLSKGELTEKLIQAVGKYLPVDYVEITNDRKKQVIIVGSLSQQKPDKIV